MDIFVTVAIVALLIFLYGRQQSEQESHEDTIHQIANSFTQSLLHLTNSQEKLYEEVEKFQERHLQHSEKQMTKQLELLKLQTKEYLGTVREGMRTKETPVDKIGEFINKPVPNIPLPQENDIEKTNEVPEYPLSDIDRVPIAPGINVKFEGQEEILPITIEPIS